MMRRSALAAALLCTLGSCAPVAHAASTFTVRGAGFGHGVGMSQYGALGYAQHGAGYRDILRHYYTGTALGRLDAASEIRVLLQSGTRSVRFDGAVRVAGGRALRPGVAYRVTRSGGGRV